MSTYRHVDADRWVNLFAREISEFAHFWGSKQSFGLFKSFRLVCTSQRGLKLLVLELVAIHEVNKTLSYLEKVAVWLIRWKVNVKLETTVCWNLLASGRDRKRVFDFSSCGFVCYFQKSPIDAYWEAEFVLKGHSFRFTDTTWVRKLEINRLHTEL